MHQDEELDLQGTQLSTADAYTVERLTRAGLNAMERACLDVTTPAEVVSAALNILDHTLYVLNETAEDPVVSCKEIRAALTELLISHGHLPN